MRAGLAAGWFRMVKRRAMADPTDAARDHYRAGGLRERLQAALARIAPAGQPLTPERLRFIDQFHVRGLAATADLAALAAPTRDDSVLDIGSGVGGPARWLAANYGCRVTGVDLSEDFVDAARYLSDLTGQRDRVSFHCGSALDLPFDDAGFDLVLLQNVAMNIAERPRLYRQVRRVLRRGGRFATFDVVRAEGSPHYPLPWARGPQASFLLDAQATRAAIEAAGLRTLEWRDDTSAAVAWARQMLDAGPATSPGLALVMGPDFPLLAANLARSLVEGRLGVSMAVFDAV